MFDVLVVEDEPVIARLVGSCVSENRWLKLAGVAATRQQAIDVARRVRPDLVLLDFGLPDSLTDGFDVWHVLHELDKVPDVIVVTAFTEMSTVERAQRHGAFGYVVKPFTSATMGAKLADYADFRRRPMAPQQGADQITIDRYFNPRHRSCSLPSGLERKTLDSIVIVLDAAERPLRASEIAERADVERETANRYLIYLCDERVADRVPEHGHPGRPAYLYTLASIWKPAPEDPATTS
jgi:response regulator of citrate/malate metabolism